MKNHWTRRMGETIARLSKKAQRTLLNDVMEAPSDIRRGIITSYVIARIKAATSPEEIPTFLSLAQKVGILTEGTPVKGLLFYHTDETTFIPANPDTERVDKQAAAILMAARSQNSQLRKQAE